MNTLIIQWWVLPLYGLFVGGIGYAIGIYVERVRWNQLIARGIIKPPHK